MNVQQGPMCLSQNATDTTGKLDQFNDKKYEISKDLKFVK